MREIRLTGTSIEELKRGIEFVLNNQEYGEGIKQITNIEVTNNCLYASSRNDRYLEQYPDESKLPIPVDIDGFASMVSMWWEKQEKPNYDSYADCAKKGFIISSGRDWGELDAAGDFGNPNKNFTSDENNSVIKMNNSDITIIINEEIYSK